MSGTTELFETIFVNDGRPLRLREHLARLSRSAGDLGLDLPQDIEAVEEKCRAAGDGRMRVKLSAGAIEVTMAAFPGYAEELYVSGAVALIAAEAGHPLGARAGHKSLPYDVMIEARDRAEAEGALEVIFRDGDGALLEGSVSNLFVVIDGTLVTPPLSRPILPGVTRAAAIRHVRELEIEVCERDVAPKELAGASEAFLTSSLMLALPLRQLGAFSFSPGQVARDLRDLLLA